jgi:hypothetical protein
MIVKSKIEPRARVPRWLTAEFKRRGYQTEEKGLVRVHYDADSTTYLLPFHLRKNGRKVKWQNIAQNYGE